MNKNYTIKFADFRKYLLSCFRALKNSSSRFQSIFKNVHPQCVQIVSLEEIYTDFYLKNSPLLPQNAIFPLSFRCSFAATKIIKGIHI